jgi:hypothetical protein
VQIDRLSNRVVKPGGAVAASVRLPDLALRVRDDVGAVGVDGATLFGAHLHHKQCLQHRFAPRNELWPSGVNSHPRIYPRGEHNNDFEKRSGKNRLYTHP